VLDLNHAGVRLAGAHHHGRDQIIWRYDRGRIHRWVAVLLDFCRRWYRHKTTSYGD